MNCPRCNVLVKESKFQVYDRDQNLLEVNVDSCPECKGIWLQKEELEYAERIVEPCLVEIKKVPKESQQYTDLFCPNCSSKVLMEKAVNRRDDVVIMDVCKKCNGVWLDGGELKAIQREDLLSMAVKVFKWAFRI